MSDKQLCRKAYDDFYHKIKAEVGYDHWVSIWNFIQKRRGEPVAWRWQWKDLPDSGWQLSSVCGWRETDAIRAEPLYLAPIAPQPALDAADLAFIADELRQAGKNRAADLVLTAMAYPTQPAEPVKVPSDVEMAAIWDEAHKPFGGAPFLMSHVEYSRALLARYGSTTGEATKQQREIEESMRRGARLTDHRFKL